MITTISEYCRFIAETRVKRAEKIDIYRTSKYIVVRPLTYEASCKYGAFSKWCMSVPHNDYLWDDADNKIIIIIIQRDYQISKEKQLRIDRFLELKDELDNSGVLANQDEYDELFSTDVIDLPKIAITFTKNNIHKGDIWDNNNIRINDDYIYGYVSLPLDRNVIIAIENYLKSFDIKNENISSEENTNIAKISGIERKEEDFEASPVGNFRKSITYTFDIKYKRHANFRKYRNELDEEIISDSEIIEMIKDGAEKIVDDVLNGKILINTKFLLTKKLQKLNLVVLLVINDDLITVTVITVLRHRNFHNVQNHYKIIIP